VKRVDDGSGMTTHLIGKPEFKGLKVMMVLLNNFDIKDLNKKILVIHNDRGETELKYFVADLGGTLGKCTECQRSSGVLYLSRTATIQTPTQRRT